MVSVSAVGAKVARVVMLVEGCFLKGIWMGFIMTMDIVLLVVCLGPSALIDALSAFFPRDRPSSRDRAATIKHGHGIGKLVFCEGKHYSNKSQGDRARRSESYFSMGWQERGSLMSFNRHVPPASAVTWSK